LKEVKEFRESNEGVKDLKVTDFKESVKEQLKEPVKEHIKEPVKEIPKE